MIYTDWFLPAYKAGGPITSIANLVESIHTFFDIHLVCGDRDYLETKPYQSVEFNRWIESSGIRVMYLSSENQKKSIYRDIIQEVKPDIIYINGIFSKSFSILPLLAARHNRAKVIVAPRGMLSKSALRIKKFKKGIFLSFAKAMKLYKGVEFHATSFKEKSDVQDLAPESRITVIPNLPRVINSSELNRSKEPNELKMITVARLAPEKNVLFALACLRGIPEHLNIEWKIIGADYDLAYKKLCLSESQQLPANVHIEFLGSRTPNEVGELYQDSHLFFLPTLGENYGHAIIEALLNGVPVLISDQTPWKNLSFDGLGADYSLNDSSAFTTYITVLAEMNQSQYELNSKDIALKVRERINYEVNVTSYKAMFNE